MKLVMFALIALTLLAAACSDSSLSGISGPSSVGPPARQYSATVTVLDGFNPLCDGVCTVTKWPLYPAEDWTPIYYVQNFNNDPCTIKWGSPWHTYAGVDHDDDYQTPPYYWCQQ